MTKVSFFNEKNISYPTSISPLPENIKNIFPLSIRKLIEKLPVQAAFELEEIRVRLNRPIIFYIGKTDYTLTSSGKLTRNIASGIEINKTEIEKILHTISQSSIYAWEEEFKRGYITLKGGHRVGLTGKVILDKGLVKSMKNISGLNFRIAHELIGVATKVMPYLIDKDLGFRHTLLVSPPQCGKTTLLRDIIRQLSDGVPSLNFEGVNVGLVDERSELAGSHEGVPQFNIGFRTDILDGCPKAQGMIMLIRSMSPQVIATDEIGTLEDIMAMEEVLNAGISLLTTVHGRDIEDLVQRPNLCKIIEQKFFKRIIVLSRSLGVGTVENIIDGTNMEPILSKPLKGGWVKY